MHQPTEALARETRGSGAVEAARIEASPAGSREGREREALLRVAAAAAGASSLEDVLELAAEEAREAIGAASLSVGRFDHERGELESLINVGDLGGDEVRFPADEIYPVSEHPNVAALMRAGTAYFNDLDDAHCDPSDAELLRRLGKSSDVGVPITLEGEIWGEVWASQRIGDPPFRADDLSFLEAIAGQFAAAIARAELFSKISKLAYQDALTGLPNRRALEERLDRAVGRAKDGGELAMLICDLDRLKEINDGQGHDAGDRALRTVAEALVAATADRPGAFVARLAGDEFCVLLEGRQGEDAVVVCEAAIEQLASGPGSLSLSGGTATVGEEGGSAAELLKSADTALYVAKRRGGGQVCSTSDGGSPAGRSRPETSIAAASGNPISTAVDALAADLDARLADAPVLDRLEAVASAFTRAGDFATWGISIVRPGSDVLVDLSLGDNRTGHFHGVRISTGLQKYRVEDYPQTAAILAPGAGSFAADRFDQEADPSERRLLDQLGFDSVLGAAASDGGDVYLLELYGDARTVAPRSVRAMLRLAVAAAMPSPARRQAASGPEDRAAAELPLLLGRRLSLAERVESAAAAVVEELQRLFECEVGQVVALDGDGWIQLVAECGAVRTRRGWPQAEGTGLVGRCLAELEPVLSSDVHRDPQYRRPEGCESVQSELVVPVRSGRRVWGAINLEDAKADRFGPDDCRLLETVAGQLGAAVEALELRRELTLKRSLDAANGHAPTD